MKSVIKFPGAKWSICDWIIFSGQDVQFKDAALLLLKKKTENVQLAGTNRTRNRRFPMDKAVMLSVRPKWSGLIAIGEKTIEARKKRPKIKPPFKCFIYETQAETDTFLFIDKHGQPVYKGRGAVIGGFICDDIKSEKEFMNGALPREETCLSDEDLVRYAGYDTPLFYWHISDLVIYDTPRPLSDFGLKRPPQSWCYVKEVNE